MAEQCRWNVRIPQEEWGVEGLRQPESRYFIVPPSPHYMYVIVQIMHCLLRFPESRFSMAASFTIRFSHHDLGCRHGSHRPSSTLTANRALRPEAPDRIQTDSAAGQRQDRIDRDGRLRDLLPTAALFGSSTSALFPDFLDFLCWTREEQQPPLQLPFSSRRTASAFLAAFSPGELSTVGV